MTRLFTKPNSTNEFVVKNSDVSQWHRTMRTFWVWTVHYISGLLIQNISLPFLETSNPKGSQCTVHSASKFWQKLFSTSDCSSLSALVSKPKHLPLVKKGNACKIFQLASYCCFNFNLFFFLKQGNITCFPVLPQIDQLCARNLGKMSSRCFKPSRTLFISKGWVQYWLFACHHS